MGEGVLGGDEVWHEEATEVMVGSFGGSARRGG